MRSPRTLIAVALLACAGVPAMAADASFEAAKADSLAAFARGDCAKVWTLLWPFAKSGSVEARATLFGAMWSAGLVPPGRSDDHVTALRDQTILSAYGSVGGDGPASDFVRGVVGLIPDAQAGVPGKSFKACLAGAEGGTACLDAAVGEKLLPTFEAYASELDAVAAAIDTPARCVALAAPPLPILVPAPQ